MSRVVELVDWVCWFVGVGSLPLLVWAVIGPMSVPSDAWFNTPLKSAELDMCEKILSGVVSENSDTR